MRMGEFLGSLKRRVRDRQVAVDKDRFGEKYPIRAEYVGWSIGVEDAGEIDAEYNRSEDL